MVARKLIRSLTVVVAALLVGAGSVACEAIIGTLHDRSDGGAADATVPADGSLHADARPHADAHLLVDAHLHADAGPDADAGHVTDAGHRTDTGHRTDAHPGTDAGPNSCIGAGKGVSDCPAGTGQESCCTSLGVDGGTYYRSYKAGDAGFFGLCGDAMACDGGTEEGNKAKVSTFRLDKYLVTVGRFRRFRDALVQGAGLPAAESGRHTYLNGGSGLANSGADAGYELGWLAPSWNHDVVASDDALECAPDGGFSLNTWTPDAAGTNESLPIGCVNWWEAYAFCIWDGGFLPSEAEWEYAAAGGSQQREYPWGSANPLGNNYANYGNETSSEPVGSDSAGAARWGQLDMAGAAYEWVLDYFAPYVDPCADCAYLAPTPQGNRAIRAQLYGSLQETAYLTPPYRTATSPIGRNTGAGFRCARAP